MFHRKPMDEKVRFQKFWVGHVFHLSTTRPILRFAFSDQLCQNLVNRKVRVELLKMFDRKPMESFDRKSEISKVLG